MTARVFFYVQHLLGIGHLRRAATLARALAAGGFDVLLVSGGAPVDGLALGGARLHQLPPVRAADARLKELARLDGSPLDEAFRASRTRQLLDLFEAEQPDILLTEQFPFGRTQLRFELLPLLEAAQDRPSAPWIVSSIRDVLRRTASPARVDEMVQTFEAFDAVLVHADPALVRLDDSFPAWPDIQARALYTGYVSDQDAPVPDSAVGKGEVIVSAGGGAVGAPLLQAALAARPLTALADRRWRLLVGPNMPDAERAALAASAGPDVIVEPVRADFPALLRNASLSISQAGYNTVVETLCHGDRAVLVPFGTARETEQADRARVLVERGMVAAVAPGELTPESLAAAIARAWAGPSIRSFPPVDGRGASATVAALRQMVSP
ncbi:glycosyltransferase [Reyranella sp.]|jgi:predicted glycosyltransferase|uniref:glycosyltransferase family protein n=1 Tax=Reyranella sp. TaxID=1929291 RepID=UPI00261B260A|nr:glycosyltransferase [Reyranella sp.]HQS15850.1 glycosyltransferase [Reyranella sp.]HQT13116.1 glycosyltransferase [Reyranella sp.]